MLDLPLASMKPGSGGKEVVDLQSSPGSDTALAKQARAQAAGWSKRRQLLRPLLSRHAYIPRLHMQAMYSTESASQKVSSCSRTLGWQQFGKTCLSRCDSGTVADSSAACQHNVILGASANFHSRVMHRPFRVPLHTVYRKSAHELHPMHPATVS